MSFSCLKKTKGLKEKWRWRGSGTGSTWKWRSGEGRRKLKVTRRQVLTTVATQSNHPTNPTNSLHTLTPVQHTNTMASGGNTEQPLSSVLPELNRFH